MTQPHVSIFRTKLKKRKLYGAVDNFVFKSVSKALRAWPIHQVGYLKFKTTLERVLFIFLTTEK